jgi:predicted membrane protein
VSLAVEAPQIETEPTGRRWAWTDVAYFVFLVYFAGGAVVVLAHGIGAVLASASPALHDSLHIRALGTGLLARAALRMADQSHHIASAPQVAFDYAFSVLNFGLAILLLWLRPRDRTARLLAVALIGAAGAFNLTAQGAVEVVPLTGFETWLQTSSHIIAGLAYVYALLLFPDGRPVPRWRPIALIPLYAPISAAAVFLALRAEGTQRPVVLLVFHGLVTPIAAVLAQGYRFRRASTPEEHAQARLLVWALVPAIIVGAYFVYSQGFSSVTEQALAGRHLPDVPVAVFRLFQPVYLLIPLALFLGLQRYRLWDIDRVVNRTLVWGVASGVVLGLGVGFVVLLQRLLSPFTSGNDIAVALSTLVAAAAFLPVRRRIQDFVDRRFYRSRYDAQRTIETFSARLRDELDLESLGYELRGVVAGAMQPSHLTLLLRGDGGGLSWQWTYKGRD